LSKILVEGHLGIVKRTDNGKRHRGIIMIGGETDKRVEGVDAEKTRRGEGTAGLWVAPAVRWKEGGFVRSPRLSNDRSDSPASTKTQCWG
jgi:hypothetical protein